MVSPLFEDTIAALATAPGRGAVALLRVSGPDAAPILLSICPDLAGALPHPRLQRLLPVVHPETGERLDRCLVTYFPAPHSYTGEDCVEISTHGGALTPQLVLGALHAAGARHAEAGEFTRRAHLNGKIDLLQAEAILDLIDGRSPALHRVAVHQMERGLSQRLDELRAALLRTEALVAYGIDFPDEDEPPVPPGRILEAAREVARRLEAILATAPQGEMLRDGALIVLAGRPNSGKSSLFNALLGVERAIVTEIPGTTRDALEAEVVLGGYPFRLIDTAGLRDTTDRIEAIGIEVAHRYLQAAHIVLFCMEAGRGIDPEEERFLAKLDVQRTLVVRTKADIVPGPAPPPGSRGPWEIHLSARSGDGLLQLHETLLERAFGRIRHQPTDHPLVTRERHTRALRRASDEVERFIAAAQDDLPMELAATHLRGAAAAIEELIGSVEPDDVLTEVFGRFCIGK